MFLRGSGPRISKFSFDGDASLTLGACGLAAIELIDGQNGACAVYRTIPVADLDVPPDDTVVLCSPDTAFAPSCDITAAGRSALKDGWLQNGPSDGIRLRGTAGVDVEIGYEFGLARKFGPRCPIRLARGSH